MARGRQSPSDANKVLARNRKARHEYTIDETCEAGLALVGSEVKSIRDGKIALVDAYAVIEGNEDDVRRALADLRRFEAGQREPMRLAS